MPNVSRRSFMGITGGIGTASMVDSPKRWINKLVSLLNPIDDIRHGIWYHYMTTCQECPAGCGMIMRHRDGRVVKVEGNANHPVNHGGLCPRGQSAVQGLYDPDRLITPEYKDKNGWNVSTWNDAFSAIAPLIKNNQKNVLLISGLQTASFMQKNQLFTDYLRPQGTLIYEVFNYEYLRNANRMLFNKPVVPSYDLQSADFILSLGSDFLETWVSPVEYTRALADGRTPDLKKNLSYMVYAGPRRSMTGHNSDEFVFVDAQKMRFFALALLREILNSRTTVNSQEVSNLLLPFQNMDFVNLSGVSTDTIKRIAQQLSNASKPLVLAGPTAARNEYWATDTAIAAGLLNYTCNAIDVTVNLDKPHILSATATEEETETFLSGISSQTIVFIIDKNIAFDRPSACAYLKKAGAVIYLSTLKDETAECSSWLLPLDSNLERWGEYEPYRGIHSIMQPGMNRLYDTRSPEEVMVQLSNLVSGNSLPASYFTLLKNQWEQTLYSPSDNFPSFDLFWKDVLRKGYYAKAGEITVTQNRLVPNADIRNRFTQNNTEPGALDLWFWPSILFFDGRTANRDWLQEAPEPVSNFVWDSWADLHPSTASQLKVDQYDLIKITSGSNSIIVPVHTTVDTKENTVAVMMGQGHSSTFLNVAFSRGVNAFVLDTPSLNNWQTTIVKSKGSRELVRAIDTSHQHGRDILKTVSYNKLVSGEAEKEEILWPLPRGYKPSGDLYAPHYNKKHRWAMVIDLQRCTGCGACAVACYAENNIDIVGKDRVDLGREMAWLKVVPYIYDEEKHTIAWLPLPCQQCDAAPCEPVCPVFASVHMDNGINAQVYNRCIGTRDCMNNCPYKVRRFNWLNPKWRESLTMQLNPEVTVRSRGVMEKCTFCIQRIRNAEYTAAVEHRQIREEEVQPACVESCPARVYMFGDILDENSEIYKVINSNKRRYQVLRDLNTKPAVIYLKKIRQQ